MDLCDERDLRALLRRHGFRFSHALGQNFLIDAAVPESIAEGSGAGPGAGVLEIGPGVGCLTRHLARRAERVVAVELDKRLPDVLRETLGDLDNVTVLRGDILEYDLKRLVQEHFDGLTPIVCANLPYQITTPVLVKLMESGAFRSVTVMVQREAARRICARSGSGEYGAFSVFMQFYADCRILFDVPPSAFLPQPKVTSAVLRCTLRDAPPVRVEDSAFFFRTVRAAFAMRRKTLLNNLNAAFSSTLSKQALGEILRDCGIAPAARGETLSMEQFTALARALKEAERQ